MRSARGARDRGFTLVELMVVVLILGILVSIAVASYYVASGRSKAIACMQNQRVLQSAINAYQLQVEYDLPAGAGVDALKPYVNWPSVNYGLCTESTVDVPKKLYIENGLVKCPTPSHKP